MRFAYAHLCDFFTLTHDAKPIFLGVFDYYMVRPAAERKSWEPVDLAPSYLVTCLGLGQADPETFVVRIRLVNGDGAEVWVRDVPCQTRRSAPGLEHKHHTYIHLLGFRVPDFGDYRWEFYVDGQRIGELETAVLELQPAGGTPS